MSSGVPLSTSLLKTPAGREVEVVLLRLPDGRLVARTAEEVKAANPEPTPATEPR